MRIQRSDTNTATSVADLVIQFKTAQCQLDETVYGYDIERFRSLEETIKQLFQSIERRVPRDAAEFGTIATFYLDLLEDCDGGFNKRLHDGLRQLFDRHTPRGHPKGIGFATSGQRQWMAGG
jgi:hypothetical protein